MAINYTISWNKGNDESSDSKTRTLELHVVSDDAPITPLNVYTATQVGTGLGFPALNTTFPGDATYYLQRRSAPRNEGPRYAVVLLTYGRGQAQDKEDTNTPTRYRVRNGVTGEATDADVNGNALVNTAGDPFSGTVQTNISSLFIDVIRVETVYNLPQALAYTNKVNSDSFQLAGYPINPGEAYCLGIQPEGDYALGDDTVTVVYSFELRERLTVRPGGERVTAFSHRILDQGRRAWIYDGSIVEIFNANGELGSEPSPVSQDVLLNDGEPLDETSHISVSQNFDPADGRGWLNELNRAPNAIRDKDGAAAPTFLLYEKHLTANFGALGLG